MQPSILIFSDISKISVRSIENWRQLSKWLIISFDEAPPDYLEEIAKNIDNWSKGERAIVVDPDRFFEKSFWKPFSINNKHLPKILAIDLSKWDNNKLVKLSSYFSKNELSSWPAVQLSFEEAYSLLYRYSDYYYQVGMLLTDLCNLRCEMCMFHSTNEADYDFSKHRRRDRLPQEVRSESVYNFIDQLLPGSSILFSASGELLMCRRALEYIDYASQKKHTPVVITNGMLLTRDIAVHLLEAGVRQFIISVDGHKEDIYQKRRKGGNLAKVLENIHNLRTLIDKQGLPATIDINTILFSDLEDQKEDMVAFWREKVDQLTFLVERTDYCGKPRKLFLESAPVTLCLEPMVGPLLLSNGLIAPCCSIAIAEWFEPMEWLLDIRETSLSQAVKTYRLMMLDQESPLRDYCSRCHYWANSFWYNGKSPFSEVYKFEPSQSISQKIKKLLKRWA